MTKISYKTLAAKVSESNIQSAYIEWVRAHGDRHILNKLLFAVPNGGSRHVVEAVNLKRQGVRAGVPDVILPMPLGGYTGLAIEFKSDAGRIRDVQAEFMDNLAGVGWFVIVCRSTETAIKATEQYLNGKAPKSHKEAVRVVK